MAVTSARETLSLPQRLLLDELEACFGGDQGARIFVQAALLSARLSALPKEPALLLDFARAHLLVVLTGEIGERGAAAFLARLQAAMEVFESGMRDRPVMPDVDIPITFDSIVPPRPERVDSPRLPLLPPSGGVTSSGRVPAARLRVVLVHGDRFGRIGIARHLLQAFCDVDVVDSYRDLARLDATLPPVAIVHLGARDVDVLLDGLLERNPALRVVAILADDDRGAGEALLAQCQVQYYQLTPSGVRAAEVATIARKVAFW
ncbi:MAG: hypothetical protein JNL79_03585 [Myxococcales bacterium]|nr:hypothetical protein [Myxococcales bacterium]